MKTRNKNAFWIFVLKTIGTIGLILAELVILVSNAYVSCQGDLTGCTPDVNPNILLIFFAIADIILLISAFRNEKKTLRQVGFSMIGLGILYVIVRMIMFD